MLLFIAAIFSQEGDRVHKAPIDARTSAAAFYQYKSDASGAMTVETSNRIIVKFGDERAHAVLERVLKLFKIE